MGKNAKRDWVMLNEACKITGRSKPTIMDWLETGMITYDRSGEGDGHFYMINLPSLMRYIAYQALEPRRVVRILRMIDAMYNGDEVDENFIRKEAKSIIEQIDTARTRAKEM